MTADRSVRQPLTALDGGPSFRALPAGRHPSRLVAPGGAAPSQGEQRCCPQPPVPSAGCSPPARPWPSRSGSPARRRPPPPSRDADGSQPLPGYTISNPPLAPLVVGGAPTDRPAGRARHAGVHHRGPAELERRPGDVGARLPGPDHGALAGDARLRPAPAAAGPGVRLGVVVVRPQRLRHPLRRAEHQGPGRPLRRHRATGRTGRYLAGVSMGGYIIGRSLEQYPGYYDGALPMCGVLGDHELLDFFLDYNLVAQALAGVPRLPDAAGLPDQRGAADPGGARPGRAHPDRPGHHQRARQAAARHHHQPLRRAAPGRGRRLRGLEGLPLRRSAPPTAATPPPSGPASSPPTCSPATPRTPRWTSTPPCSGSPRRTSGSGSRRR